MKTIQVQEPGGPEKMQLVEVPVPQPGPQQALVRLAAIGVNFIDVYFRMGRYPQPLPCLGLYGPSMPSLAWKEALQPQLAATLGLSNRNPAPISPSL